MIAQTVVRNSSSFPPMTREKDYTTITNYSSGLVRIDVPAILQLKQLIRFTQMRYFCRKGSTGRTFHIMTKNDPFGEKAVRYLTEDPYVQPRACHEDPHTILFCSLLEAIVATDAICNYISKLHKRVKLN